MIFTDRKWSCDGQKTLKKEKIIITVAAVNDVRVVFDYALTTSLSSSSPPSFNSKVSKRNLNNACH